MALCIGVSAHRNIKPEAAPQVKKAVRATLEQILRLRADGEVVMLNGLAEGGDMLCGQVARELGIKTLVALPAEKDEYLSADFSDEGKALFRILSTAENVIRTTVVPDVEGRIDLYSGQARKDYLFRQQTVFVATQSDILLAPWDGAHSGISATECGTAFAVRVALERNYPNAKNDGIVIAVFAPRDGKTYAAQPNTVRFLVSGKTHGYYDEYADMPEQFKTLIVNK